MKGSSKKDDVASSPSTFDPQQVLKATKALLAFVTKKQGEQAKSELFVESETVTAMIALHKIPDRISKVPVTM